jgi:hypothetical protein
MANLKQLRQPSELRAVAAWRSLLCGGVYGQAIGTPDTRCLRCASTEGAALCRLERGDIFELEQAVRESDGLQ